MVDYKELYFKLSGVLADTIEELGRLTERLKAEQLRAEEAVVNSEE